MKNEDSLIDCLFKIEGITSILMNSDLDTIPKSSLYNSFYVLNELIERAISLEEVCYNA